jgi:hypothetical protein
MVIRRRRNYRNRVYTNLKLFLDDALVARGWYLNVASGETDWHSNNLSRLLPVQTDASYPVDSGTTVHIWQGYRQNWVSESGVTLFTSGLTSPTIPRSVFVSGVSHPVRPFDGSSGIAIDFRNGRVIFESGVSFSTTVEVAHSEKEVWIDTVSRDLITNQITKIDNTKRTIISNIPSGEIGNLPTILMEMTSSPEPRGMELGGGLILKPTIFLHVVSNNRWDKDELIDFIEQRKDQVITLIDLDGAPAQFTYEGDFASGFLAYDSFKSTYRDKNLYITGVSLIKNDDIAQDGYFTATLRMETEIWVKEEL